MTDDIRATLRQLERHVANLQNAMTEGFAAPNAPLTTANERIAEMNGRLAVIEEHAARVERAATQGLRRIEARLQRIEDRLYIETLEFVE